MNRQKALCPQEQNYHMTTQENYLQAKKTASLTAMTSANTMTLNAQPLEQ